MVFVDANMLVKTCFVTLNLQMAENIRTKLWFVGNVVRFKGNIAFVKFKTLEILMNLVFS